MREVLKDAENKPNSLDIVVDENTKSEEQAPPPPKKKGKDVLDSVFDGL